MKCFVNFKSYSWFKNDFNKIEAHIEDQNGDKSRMLIGDWSKFIYSMDVETHKRYLQKMTNSKDSKPQMQDLLKDLSEDPSSNCRCLWQVRTRPKNSTKVSHLSRPPGPYFNPTFDVDVQHDRVRHVHQPTRCGRIPASSDRLS